MPDVAELRERVAAPAQDARALLRRFWPLTKPDRPLLLAAALLLIVAAAADTVAVLMFMDVIDGVVEAKSLDAFWPPAAVWGGVAVAGALATAAGSYLSARAAERFSLRLRDRTFSHLQRLSPDFFGRHPVGDLVARLSGDVEEIETLVSSGVVRALSATVTVLFFIATVFWLRWDLAVVVLAGMPLLVLASRRFAKRIRVTAQHERSSNGAISDVVQQGIANIALVQAYATEQVEAERVHAHGSAWMRARLAQMRIASIFTPLTDLLETIGVLAVLGVGAWEITEGRMTIGALVAFATFLGFLNTPVRALSGLVLSMTSARASSDRLAEVLDAVPIVADDPRALRRPATHGMVALSQVTFGYPGAAGPAVRDLTFTAAPGKLVLITGPSGAGKSTIARLLLRFYDPGAGRIEIDGVDVAQYSLSALRHSVTLLPQETVIIDGTVAENIAYGTPDANPHRIRAAARDAHADAFIARLPQGYRTRLGARGPQLSGGQKQRIAIARALVRNTPVLVLDEPTTGLDGPATAAVLPALRGLMRGRTTILITHDLALAPLADTIVVLDAGGLVQSGNHRSLLASGGLYAHLHGSQFTARVIS